MLAALEGQSQGIFATSKLMIGLLANKQVTDQFEQQNFFD